MKEASFFVLVITYNKKYNVILNLETITPKYSIHYNLW